MKETDEVGQQLDSNVTSLRTFKYASAEEFITDVCQFKADCEWRYAFNSRLDNTLNVLGILLSLGIIAAGVYNQGKLSAVLGGLVAALVTMQRAFPFNQRTTFYRNLIGQIQNRHMDLKYGFANSEQASATLKALRLDFAQQLPRGTSFKDVEK
jgi:hypothetical protein